MTIQPQGVSMKEKGGECNPPTGLWSIPKLCANMWCGECPIRKRSTPSNVRFGTDYTRSAAIGRARRMGLISSNEPEVRANRPAATKMPGLLPPRSNRRSADQAKPPSAFERAEPVTLRCVGISPRLVSLVDLQAHDCRYPYGGDKEGEAIVFCGHPRFAGSSYCLPHFELTRGSDTAS